MNVKKLDIKRKQLILNSIRKFISIFNESIEIELSAEHFFDFSLVEFFEKNSINNLKNTNNSLTKNLFKIDSSIISALTAEIDRFSMPSIGSDALIKIVLFLSKEPNQILFLDEKVFIFLKK